MRKSPIPKVQFPELILLENVSKESYFMDVDKIKTS